MRSRFLLGIKIAAKTLSAHPLRVALAMLAVMIGVASVILMVGIGKGAEDEVRKKIEAMGTNLIIVSAARSLPVKGQVGRLGIATTLTLKDAAAIRDECSGIARMAPVHFKKLPVKYDTFSYSTRVVGTTAEIMNVRNITIQSGTFFGEDEDRLMSAVAVVGPTIVQNFFGGNDPVGESIRVGKVLFKVIGVTASKGSLSGEDEDDQIFIPLRTAMNKLMNVTYLSNVFVETASFESILRTEGEIRALLRERHRIRGGMPDDFTIQNQADVIAAQNAAARTFSVLVGSIAAISLVIGGVGILAVMLLSIRERVAEIGIRRAVGARRKDILVQFLVESSFLGMAGGVVGIVVGIAASVGLGSVSGMPVVLSVSYMLLALGFAVAVGMLFGIYPSWKAAGLDPIQALHTRV